MGILQRGKTPRPECSLAVQSDLDRQIDQLTTKAAEKELNDNMPVGELRSIRRTLTTVMETRIRKCGPISIHGKQFRKADPKTIDGLIRDKRGSLEVPEEEM